MAESDGGDDKQDTDIDTRLVGESRFRSEPDAIGCLPLTPFTIHPAPTSVHGRVSQYLHVHSYSLTI